MTLREIARKYRIDAVVLFGSRATGTARKDSDVDVCIVAPRFRGSQVDLINDMQRLYRVDVDVSVYHRTGPSLKFAVATEGKLLYGGRRLFERLKLAAIKEWQDSRKIDEAANAYISARV